MERLPAVISLLLLAACGAPTERGEEAHATTASQAFTSAAALLVDFEFDATLHTDTVDAGALDRLIQAQLLFSVGQLNGESSVGRVDRADYKVTTVVYPSAGSPTYEVDYHVRMPVAWGGGPAPSSYALTLPRSVSDSAQATFVQKYGGRCTDPEGGDVGVGEMFLFYRPHQAGCSLDPADVVSTTATSSEARENTTGKYPEYHRIWEDGELDFVAIFGRELDAGGADDEGAQAYQRFLDGSRSYLRALEPDAALRTEDSDPATAEPNVRFAVTLADGRRIRLDVISVPPSIHDDPAFDAWYDARSADADAFIYSGHAGLGDNVRALMTKGVFRPKKYVMAVLNGCDSFAYVDDTLAARRQALNPDDPAGTRYMDTLTNVLGGYFHSGDKTSLQLLGALVSAAETAPKTYGEIFQAVDPTQMMLVSGEEDNEFAPGMMPPPPGGPAEPPGNRTAASSAPPSPSEPTPRRAHHASCAAAPDPGSSAGRFPALAVGFLAVLAARRRRRVHVVASTAIAIAGGSP